MELPGGYPELAVVSAHVLEGGGVASVVIVDPVLPLPPQQRDVLAVDHHHVVPAVGHRVIHGLVTPLEHLRHNYVRMSGLRGITLVMALAEVNGFCHFAS